MTYTLDQIIRKTGTALRKSTFAAGLAASLFFGCSNFDLGALQGGKEGEAEGERDAMVERYDGGMNYDGETKKNGCTKQPFFLDSDGDRFGNAAYSLKACKQEQGYVANSDDCDDTNEIVYPGAQEVCDGYSNDCETPDAADGSGDKAPLNSRQSGVCAGSVQSCTDGSWRDDYSSVSGYLVGEICDGLDNDCDGLADNRLISPSRECFTGIGECRAAGLEYQVCEGAAGWSADYRSCNAVAGEPAAELCDGLDNDCNGLIDNSLTPSSRECFTGVGECRAAGLEYQVCEGAAGWSADYRNCDAVAGELVEEICNGLDDDCDGLADNSLTPPSRECFTGAGECRRAGLEYRVCEGAAGWSADYRSCNAVAGAPREEICDGLDDDCDDVTDNSLTPPSRECFTGVGECRRTGLEYHVCEGEAGWSADYRNCNAVAGAPAEEICDELDNDCDYEIDEADEVASLISYSGPPGTQDVGICQPQIRECINGNFVTTQEEILPQTEIFDSIDNDCDGAVDEGFWLQVEAATEHTCGIRTDNTLACWGSNEYGQATPPSGTFIQVSAGEYHNCAVRTDNTLACWGNNDEGQSTPPAGTFIQVSAGGMGMMEYHTCAVRTDNTLACWGSNESGQATPPSGTFSQVSAGGQYTCGIRTDNTVACWGNMLIPFPFDELRTFSQVSAGDEYVCVIGIDDNVLECWGRNDEGQSNPPSGTFIQVSAKQYHTCAVRTDNTLACWGINWEGQSSPPAGTFIQVSAGGRYTCSVRTDGTVACWGENNYGQSTPPSP